MEDVELCDLCGASLRQAGKVAGLTAYPVVCCKDCGLVITTPRPGAKEINSFYPNDYYAHVIQPKSLTKRLVERLRIYKDSYPTEDSAPQRWFWRACSTFLGGLFLFRLPYLGPGKKLLDIGCGSGEMLEWARHQGWEVHGVELDARAVERACSRGLLNVKCGTLEDNPFPGKVFDAITLFQVLEHVHSPRQTLTRCYEQLSADGYMVVAVPNFASYPRRSLNEWWHGMDLPKHLYHFSETTLHRLADDCGLRVAEVCYYSRVVTVLLNLSSIKRVLPLMDRDQRFQFLGRVIGNSFVRDRDLRLSDCMLVILKKSVPGAA